MKLKDEVERAKSHIEVNLAKDLKGNKKECYKYKQQQKNLDKI